MSSTGDSLPATDVTLALYHYEGCYFCSRVRAAIDRLGITVELRDIHRHEEHWEALRAARGRTTVPVLRLTTPTEDYWLPESRDIIRYLEAQFG